jgi:NDP-sugar pyrophosphorylase family protein
VVMTGAKIGANAILQNSVVCAHAVVGPFCHGPLSNVAVAVDL